MNTGTQTRHEEAANALSHGVGFLLAVASLPVLESFAARQGSRGALLGVSVFSLTMMLLYFASAVYHALPRGRIKEWFNRLDHAAHQRADRKSRQPQGRRPRRDWRR